MKRFATLALFVILATGTYAQNAHHLLGEITRDSLLQEPFASWFRAAYDNYQPDEPTLAKLRKQSLKDLSFEVFFGSWCGDSKRELPRFLKLTDNLGISTEQIKMIGVDTGEQYKQSPGRETDARNIYRVATFIISRNGKEVNRITEHPVRSLELDLLDIVSGLPYHSNYRSYPLVKMWLEDGLLAHPNVSIKGLAKQLKPLLISPSELNACGHVLLAQQKHKEATTVFQINAYLFFDQVDPYVSLAESLDKEGKQTEALDQIKNAFRLNEDDDQWSTLLDTYYSIRSRQKLEP
jgi:tetratricopeptide (TPR) repeat protein